MKRILVTLCCLIFLCGCTDKGIVENPEGIIPEDINVPQSVLDAAIDYTKEKFDFYSKREDSGSFDNWRIEYLKPEHQYRGLEGYDLDVYSMNCEFHTTTPQKAEKQLAGGARIENGWVNYGVSTEACLVFDVSGGKEPVYLFSSLYYHLGTKEESFQKDLSEALGLGLASIKNWESAHNP